MKMNTALYYQRFYLVSFLYVHLILQNNLCQGAPGHNLNKETSIVMYGGIFLPSLVR